MSYGSYKQHAVESRWDAIVIGSGIGGLAAAALLARHGGKRVLVLERHYTPGGYTHSFHRPGYEWDVGVHYVGQAHDRRFEVRRAFDYLSEGRLEWNPMPAVYDRVVMGGRVYDFPSGAERFREQMKSYFPSDANAIDSYMRAVSEANRASGLYWASKAVPAAVAAMAGPLMRRPFLRWADRTTAGVLSGITRNRELAGVLTAQWGDYGLPPSESSFAIHALIAGHYFDGGSYPVGGAGRIAETIIPVIESAGGKVLVSAEVARVLIENRRAVGVRMADGRGFHAGIVISDAGARNTFERLVPDSEKAVESARRELRTLPPSSAHLSLYVGLKAPARDLGLEGTNLWIYPDPDHDGNVRRFVEDPSAPFPLLYISFPSAKDPDFERRHPGRATIEVVAMARYEAFERWQDSRWRKRGGEYESFKAGLSARLLEELRRHVPGCEVDYAELSTPLSTRHFMNYERGEMYGLSAVPGRFRARSLAPRTAVRGLYLTGQDVASLGVTGAMFGGVMTASAVLGRNLMSVVTRKDEPVKRARAARAS